MLVVRLTVTVALDTVWLGRVMILLLRAMVIMRLW